MTSVRALLAALLGFAALPAGGGTPHDPTLARGEHIARLVCSACHVVAKDQEFAPLLVKPAPSFYEIANRPETSAQSLEHFIKSTHWDLNTIPMTMPNPMLERDETSAVARYIVSLRTH